MADARKPRGPRLRNNARGKAIRLVRDLFKAAAKENCSGAVWDLVSALRGPDDAVAVIRDEAKAATTAVIRAALLPAAMDRYLDRRVTPTPAPRWIPQALATLPQGISEHFADHTTDAIRVLNDGHTQPKAQVNGAD